MKTLLQIRASLFSDNGRRASSPTASSQLRATCPTAGDSARLALEPVPHLMRRASAPPGEAEERTGRRRGLAYSDQWSASCRSADVIVIGLPMYNFACLRC